MIDIKDKLAVLSEIATIFNEHHLTWAVGASTLLYFKGIVDDFNDIDLMIDEDCVDIAKKLLSTLGELNENHSSDKYKSKAFLEYRIKNVDIDIIAGFTIVNDDTTHYFPLNSSDIQEVIKLDESSIYLHSVEAWKEYYFLMKRFDKVSMIKQYKQKGEIR